MRVLHLFEMFGCKIFGVDMCYKVENEIVLLKAYGQNIENPQGVPGTGTTQFFIRICITGQNLLPKIPARYLTRDINNGEPRDIQSNTSHKNIRGGRGWAPVPRSCWLNACTTSPVPPCVRQVHKKVFDLHHFVSSLYISAIK